VTCRQNEPAGSPGRLFRLSCAKQCVRHLRQQTQYLSQASPPLHVGLSSRHDHPHQGTREPAQGGVAAGLSSPDTPAGNALRMVGRGGCAEPEPPSAGVFAAVDHAGFIMTAQGAKSKEMWVEEMEGRREKREAGLPLARSWLSGGMDRQLATCRRVRQRVCR